MRARETPLVVTRPLTLEGWPDGINPYLEPIRRGMQVETRETRRAEIEAFLEANPRVRDYLFGDGPVIPLSESPSSSSVSAPGRAFGSSDGQAKP